MTAEPLAIREKSVIGRMALKTASPIKTGFRPIRSDKAPANRRDQDDRDGRKRGKPKRVALIELSGGGQECRNIGDPDIISDRAQAEIVKARSIPER